MNDREAICKAFGLDTKNLLAARVDIIAGQPIIVTAKYWAGTCDTDGLVTALKKYELKAIDE